MGLKELINGFRKINYEVDLPESFDEMRFILSKNMISAFREIENISNDYPFHDVRFGISDFSAENLGREFLDLVTTKNSPIYMYKHVCKQFETSHFYENTVITSVISLGLDGNIWKFTVKSFYTCSCLCKSFEYIFTELCLKLTDAFLKDININAMIKSSRYFINVSNEVLKNYQMPSRKFFSGYVKTFTDNDYSNKFPINEILETNNYKSFEESVVEDSLNRTMTFDEFINDDSIIVDVVRRGGIKINE